jgi:hypothetical protein
MSVAIPVSRAKSGEAFAACLTPVRRPFVRLLETEPDVASVVLRVLPAVMFFPHGA